MVALLFFGLTLGVPIGALIISVFHQPLDISLLWKSGIGDVVVFTFLQAFLSAVISVAVGFPGAYLIARTRVPAKRWFKAISMIPFVVPGMIMALGMVQLLGRQGFVPGVFAFFGRERVSLLYTFGAVVFAHALYNYPVTMRIVGDAWERMDGQIVDASKVDGASNFRILRSIELPLLITPVILSFLLAFLYCFTSFAVVLIIGGIRFSTIEVSIYQHLRVFMDFPTATLLTLIQASILGVFALVVFPLQKAHDQPVDTGQALKEKVPFWGWFYFALIAVVGMSPFWSSLAYGFLDFEMRWSVEGFRSLISLPFEGLLGVSMVQAIGYTVLLGLVSLFISVFFGLELARLKRTSIQFMAVFAAGFSPVTLAYGFIVVSQSASFREGQTPFFLPLIYAFLAFPLSYHAFRSAWSGLSSGIIESATMDGARWWGLRRWIIYPLFRKEIIGVGVLTFVIAMGELSASLTMQTPGFSTISILLYRLYASRQLLAARSLNATLLVVVFLLFVVSEWLRDPPSLSLSCPCVKALRKQIAKRIR